MTEFLLLFLMLAAPVAGESPSIDSTVGAKAMFSDPGLNVVFVASPRGTASPRDSERAGTPNTESMPGESPNRLQESRSLGIRFWIEKVNQLGEMLGKVGVGHSFRSGDRIQLAVESNDGGYLALVQQGADGRIGLLFPSSEEQLAEKSIPPHSKLLLPGERHCFTFDKKSGEIRLLIVVARSADDLRSLPLRAKMSQSDLKTLRWIEARERGAKNLIVEAFVDPEEDPATYTVHRGGGIIVHEITLEHGG